MIKGIDYPGIAIVFFCHDGNGSYLAGRRSARTRDEQGCWDIGGGGVKNGEVLQDALRREIKEEYGTDILSHEYLGFREVHRTINKTPTHWIVFDYKVHVDPARVTNGDPEKIDEIGWFKLDTLPQPQHSQIPFTINKYRDHL